MTNASNGRVFLILQELQRLKCQESAIVSIGYRYKSYLNYLKVEELHLKAMLRDERNAKSIADASTSTSTCVFVNTDTFDSSLSADEP